MFKYLDLTKEDTKRIKEARANINKWAVIFVIKFLIVFVFGSLLYFLDYNVPGLVFMIFSFLYLIVKLHICP
jgi:membrane protein YdbS with pleckstrin-like domain